MSAKASVRDGDLEIIRTGQLPDRSAERTWAGRGCGAPCVICGRPIRADELEYELEFTNDDRQLVHYHVHIGCFWPWEYERRERGSKRGAGTAVGLSDVAAKASLAEDEREASGSEGST
jgi:hypothetical protein